MKEFLTAAKQVEEEADESGRKPGQVDFTIKNEDTGDTKVCRAFKPRDGQLAVLMATTGRHSSEHEQIAGILNFFVSVLDKESHTYIVNRLLDYEDPFGIAQVESIMQYLVTEWSGRPTEQSSDSAGSPQIGGQNSTQSTPALT